MNFLSKLRKAGKDLNELKGYQARALLRCELEDKRIEGVANLAFKKIKKTLKNTMLYEASMGNTSYMVRYSLVRREDLDKILCLLVGNIQDYLGSGFHVQSSGIKVWTTGIYISWSTHNDCNQ